MNKALTDDHVLPRPVEALPEYAHAKSRQTLADKILEAFKLSSAAATVIANAVVDPSVVRKTIGEPSDPGVEEISVPGGTLLGIRTIVWSRRVMPDPRNPRIGPSRRHPFAVEPGTGGDDTRFRPVPEPHSPEGLSSDVAELVVEIENRHHLTWASQQAATYVLEQNDWSASIASQGVMEAVWLVPTTFRHADGSPPVTTLITAEGSSRATAVHSLLKIRSGDVPYDDNDSKLRQHLRKLTESVDRGPTAEELVALRCERMPALILVGFRRHPTATTGFPTAVKSLVALRHVDPPKPWGEGPENESLADEVLDELYRRDLISVAERNYFAGSCTRAEARAGHLSDDPAVRAARIVRLFTTPDSRFAEAIRVAVTSQSTRKRISPKLCNELATALILRAIAEEPARKDQVRRYLRHSFGKSVHRDKWDSTDRDTDQLVREALKEVRANIGDESITDPGPASLELAVRAAYPLVVTGRLTADRGSFNNEQPDRRHPGEVLDTMRRSAHGVLQLAQSLRDFGADQPIRAVDEAGQIRKLSDGSGDLPANDVFLRGQFPPPGKASAPWVGDTPMDIYHNRLNDFSSEMERLESSFAVISDVVGDDGRPIVETQGADPRSCTAWRRILNRIDDELNIWSRLFRRKFGTTPEPVTRDFDDSESPDDPGDETDDREWDSEANNGGDDRDDA
jgi:hypothetical protein